MSLSGDGGTLAVGAGLEDSNATGVDGDEANNSANASGAVYVFVRGILAGSGWSQEGYLKGSNTEGADAFGFAVSLNDNGNTLAVGAPGEDSNATGVDGDQTQNSRPNSGAAYVFTRLRLGLASLACCGPPP